MGAKTLYAKLWDEHVVHLDENGTALLYIDRQLVHEVTSPQAFEGLRLAGRRPWRVAANLAVPDHNVPTRDLAAGITDPVSKIQVETLDSNCAEFGITEFRMSDPRQGVVHVIGPEQGFTLPGTTVVCRSCGRGWRSSKRRNTRRPPTGTGPGRKRRRPLSMSFGPASEARMIRSSSVRM